jgi:VWFA-related protein
MKRAAIIILALVLASGQAFTQTTQKPQQQEVVPDDVVRITTQLVQTDVVVVDKNDQIVKDLTLDDFEVSDNGKKQSLKFAEFVSTEAPKKSNPTTATRSTIPTDVETNVAKGVSAKDLKRVIAFVVDDLTLEVQDITAVRKTLLDFVNNKMQQGDLVAIVRVVGGKGLLEQFTSDQQILRRAISTITPTVSSFSASNLPDPERLQNPLAPTLPGSPTDSQPEAPEIYSPNDESNRYFRGLSTMTTAAYIISRLKEIPGHKNLVIISAGVPIFETSSNSSPYTNVTGLINSLTDSAIRAGVVINTVDPRGLRATPGVVGFDQTPGRSALGGGGDPSFGRGSARDTAVFGALLAGGSEHLGLGTMASYTGGVSIVNTNDLDAGLDKILARSNGYYRLAYTPSEAFDNKFHKVEIKVRRSGAKVYSHSRYLAREDKPATQPRSKEEEIVSAARSPLVRTDIDVTSHLGLKFSEGKSSVDVNMVIDARNLHFTQNGDRFQTSLDAVGFIYDQLGKLSGGFSETLNLNLTKEQHQQVLVDGLPYSATIDLPPGYYQLRTVVREASSGGFGTFSKFLEIPDIREGKLIMGSLFLYAVDSDANAKPLPLTPLRKISHKQDLRFAAAIYSPKLKNGKPELRSQMIVSSQSGKVLYKEPEQAVETNGSLPVIKLGQLILGRVPPGRYVLTLVVKDMLANKTLTRSIDFRVTD